MANILYGVNGEGSGHSTRSKEVITHLLKRGHQVRIVSFDRGLRNLSNDFEVTEIFGFRLAYVNNRVRYRREAAAARLVTRLMTPRASAYLVISFFRVPVQRQNTFLFHPIVRQEVLNTVPREGEEVLVYVTSPAPDLVRLLSSIRGSFVAYGFGREGREGNIQFKKPSLHNFLEDLAGCRAVIGNAGFSLLSEAFHLRKPYLAMPVQHQFEQVFNAYYVEKMGYGAYWDKLTKECIESFLFNLPVYWENLSTYPRTDNSALLTKLDELISEYTGVAR